MKEEYERPLIKILSPSMPGKSGNTTSIQNINDIEGISVESLVTRFGTPLFVISEKKIRENIKDERQSFEVRYPKFELAWSYKTNYLNKVCQIMHEEGSWAEVVSEFEYDKALRNHVNGEKIIINGPNKSDNLLKKAVLNQSLIHLDNTDEMYNLERICKEVGKKANVGIRINPQIGKDENWNKFGYAIENDIALDAAKTISDSKLLNLISLHCHIGTYITHASTYSIATKEMVKLSQNIKQETGTNIKYLDLGGGFASKNTPKLSYQTGEDLCPTINEYAEAITKELNFDNEEEIPTLILETGRALIDDTSVLITSVMSNKRTPNGRRCTIIDAGVNTLFTAFWYNHKISPVKKYSFYNEETILYGPLCMNIDIIRENVLLPLTSKGDLLIIHNVGAYNMTQGMSFINLRPAVVMITHKNGVQLIRRKETIEDIENSENI